MVGERSPWGCGRCTKGTLSLGNFQGVFFGRTPPCPLALQDIDCLWQTMKFLEEIGKESLYFLAHTVY